MNKTAIIVTLLVLGGVAAYAMTGNKPAAATSTGPLIITDHDAAYDYKYENGRWYTHRKGETNWRDMQANLSPANYALAVSRLMSYVNQRGIIL